jgi:hypothetical protein
MQTGKNWIVVLAWLLVLGCTRDESMETSISPVSISITHHAAGNLLELGKLITNPHGEPLTISAFAYFLSNFALVNVDDKLVPLGLQYFLVNEKDTASKTISFFAPQGTYKAIQLMIGVDSARNVSGIQTGYIFAKLEGKSVVSTAPLQNVTYHIGGFKKQESAIQTIVLGFPEPLVVKKARNPVIDMTAEVDRWFSGKHLISISNEAFCMNPGELARKISENYAAMFTITSVTN